VEKEISMSNETPIRIALIYGSTRKGRFCDTVVRWATREISQAGAFELDAIDPAAPGALHDRLRRADAFIVVTPEYNHGYPAPLKALIDEVGAEWHAKPVAFVSYGGVSGGLRAVEQLRQVFAELHAVTIRDSVSFAGAHERFDENGEAREPERSRRSMTRLLAQLEWWAITLREARHARPYADAAAGKFTATPLVHDSATHSEKHTGQLQPVPLVTHIA
jgi:NAD(P)H-dependent FMN reductase